MSTDSYSEEESIYFILQLSGQSLREVRAVTQNRNVEAGTDAETTKEPCAAAYWVAQLAFLSNSGPPAQEWYHIQWSGLSYVSH